MPERHALDTQTDYYQGALQGGSSRDLPCNIARTPAMYVDHTTPSRPSPKTRIIPTGIAGASARFSPALVALKMHNTYPGWPPPRMFLRPRP